MKLFLFFYLKNDDGTNFHIDETLINIVKMRAAQTKLFKMFDSNLVFKLKVWEPNSHAVLCVGPSQKIKHIVEDLKDVKTFPRH